LAAAGWPSDAAAHHLLGGVPLRLEDYPGAIDELRQATRLDPALVEAHVNLGQALLRAGRKDEALAEQAEVERLKAKESGLGPAMVHLENASGLVKKGQTTAALAELEAAVASSPTFPEAPYRLPPPPPRAPGRPAARGGGRRG